MIIRHNRIRDVLAEWLKSQGIGVNTEQAVPAWHTVREQAILDVAYIDSQHGERFLDVAVLAAHTHKGLAAQIRIERHERKKHLRYPGARLIPFVLDVRGRWGKEACAWARTIVRRLPKRERAAVLQDLRWRVSNALQLAVAEQCLRALRPSRRQPPAPAAPPAAPMAPAVLDGRDVPVPETSTDSSGTDSGTGGDVSESRSGPMPVVPQATADHPHASPPTVPGSARFEETAADGATRGEATAPATSTPAPSL